ncbi:hypothetical protein MTR67_031824 [Solanum verrucosum]|uniref:Uncharacterized protein n=1 Tax=Solanum verrucosum TaxID=315347 RepID=A0AAF0U3C8_SOLVR|nr:hypothetical protein MTR67_031824 [Solanum verrucosum]
MDEKGVHSPTNAKRSTVSDNKDTASPVQTVAGKDTSNPFMAVTLPKSEGESSSRRRLPRSFTQSIIKKTLAKIFQQGQDKHVITTPPNPDPSVDRFVPNTKRGRANASLRRENPNNNITRSISSEEEDYGENGEKCILSRCSRS